MFQYPDLESEIWNYLPIAHDLPSTADTRDYFRVILAKKNTSPVWARVLRFPGRVVNARDDGTLSVPLESLNERRAMQTERQGSPGEMSLEEIFAELAGIKWLGAE